MQVQVPSPKSKLQRCGGFAGQRASGLAGAPTLRVWQPLPPQSLMPLAAPDVSERHETHRGQVRRCPCLPLGITREATLARGQAETCFHLYVTGPSLRRSGRRGGHPGPSGGPSIGTSNGYLPRAAVSGPAGSHTDIPVNTRLSAWHRGTHEGVLVHMDAAGGGAGLIAGAEHPPNGKCVCGCRLNWGGHGLDKIPERDGAVALLVAVVGSP